MILNKKISIKKRSFDQNIFRTKCFYPNGSEEIILQQNFSKKIFDQTIFDPNCFRGNDFAGKQLTTKKTF
jgi:hypothetical protein